MKRTDYSVSLTRLPVMKRSKAIKRKVFSDDNGCDYVRIDKKYIDVDSFFSSGCWRIEYLNDERINLQDLDRYILGWHVTNNGHVWIDGITGGYVEMTDAGKYFTSERKALIHRINHIKKVMGY